MHISRARRYGAALTAGGLLAAGLSLSGPAASAEAAASPAGLGAGWLTGQLTDGVLVGDFGPQYGTTIDAARALLAVGGQEPAVATMTDALAAGAAGFDPTDEGLAAKALALAVDTGRDPRSFGGTDLQERVETAISADPALAGRITGVNVLGQSFAAHALSAAGSPRAGEVVDYLLDQQCAAGFFRLSFAGTAVADQTCDGAAKPASPHPDATALAVVELADLATTDPDVAAALGRAGDWLVTQQAPDGSFADPWLGANSNTTGLAGWALHSTGRTEAAARAAGWVRAHQLCPAADCGADVPGQAGAIAYGPDALAQARSGGAEAMNATQWRMATVQALPSLLALPPSVADPAPVTTQLAVVAPDGYRRAGSRVALRVRGLAPGEVAHLQGPGVRRTVRGAAVPVRVVVRLPRRAGEPAYTVSAAKRRATVRVSTLGARTLRLTLARARVPRAGSQVVRVARLAPGERVRVLHRGRVVARGTAGTKGRFTARFAVGRVTGATTVRVRGEFAHRTGLRRFRVTG